MRDSSCECPAGLGKHCKHIAAVIYYINTESADSKTSQQCQWIIPSGSGTEQYRKGCKISELIPQKTLEKSYKPVGIPALQFSCPLKDMLNAISITDSKRIANSIIRDIIITAVDTGFYELCKDLYESLCSSNLNCQAYTQNPDFEKPFHSFFYENNIVQSYKQLANIYASTINQSECSQWFKERINRVSASIAHRIKSRKSKFDELTDSLLSEKSIKGKMYTNISYGIKNERAARELYKVQTGYKVEECGLLIHPIQQWLCASPDGIVIINDKPIRTLEIKCPITVKNQSIIDTTGKLKLPFLKFNNDKTICLVKSHSYYTQCQIQMYCAGLQECDFFIYCPKFNSLTITIPRDEEFLSVCILNLEYFYINSYIPKLILKYGL